MSLQTNKTDSSPPHPVPELKLSVAKRRIFSTLKFSLICLTERGQETPPSLQTPDQRMRPVGAGDLRCVLRGLGRSSEVETRDLGTVREMSCYKYSSVYTQSTFANKGRQT